MTGRTLRLTLLLLSLSLLSLATTPPTSASQPYNPHTSSHARAALYDAYDLDAGYLYMCARRNVSDPDWRTGGLACWGYNQNGVLGQSSRTQYGVVVGADYITSDMGGPVRQVETLLTFTYALRHDGRVAWSGRFHYGTDGTGGPVGLKQGDMGPNAPTFDLPDKAVALAHAAPFCTHACAILRNGTLFCWGDTTAGGVGNGDPKSYTLGDATHPLKNASVVDLGTGVTVLQATTGQYHTCVLLHPTHRVKCFGIGGYLGLGHSNDVGVSKAQMGDALPYLDLGTNLTVLKLASGLFGTCALTTNGTYQGVKCWGQVASHDTVGDAAGQMGDALPYMAMPDNVTAVDIFAGGSTWCVLGDDGGLRCWGDCSVMCGRVSSLSQQLQPSAPLDFGTGVRVIKATLGHDWICVVVDVGPVGQLRCQGSNHFLQLGNPVDNPNVGATAATAGDNLPPVPALDSGGVLQASLSDNHVCVLMAHSYAVKCWGDGEVLGLNENSGVQRGKFPSKTMGNMLPEVDLGPWTGRVRRLIPAGQATCAVTDNGTAVCWGVTGDGQLGHPATGMGSKLGDAPGEMPAGLVPVDLGTGLRVDVDRDGVHCGMSYAFCVRVAGPGARGRLKCWGRGSSGRTGLGSTEARGKSPGQMGDALPFVQVDDVLALACGYDHACARNASGIFCWGDNLYGQLGLGDNVDRLWPTPLTHMPFDPAQVAGIACSRGATCFLTFEHNANGSVYCVGRSPQTGRGLPANVYWGVHPNHLGSNLTAIDLGHLPAPIAKLVGAAGHFCVLLTNAAIKCWGSNHNGELGLGDDVSRGDSPSSMGDSLPLLQFNQPPRDLVCADSLTGYCVMHLDGGLLRSWGTNGHGQLGTGFNAVGISPGELHAAAPVAINACPLGTGGAECTLCPPGAYSKRERGSTQCHGCPAGTYGTLAGRTSSQWCLACAPGTVAPTTGLSTCVACLPGTYAPTAASNSCVPCPQHTFQPSPGASQCLPCAAGLRTASTGAVACTGCQPGEYLHAATRTCRRCPAGSYSDRTEATACSPCPAGTVTPLDGATACIACGVGEYAPANATACLDCPPGTHAPTVGTGVCQPCAQGLIAPVAGAEQCLGCGEGARANANRTLCTCDPGFGTTTGSTGGGGSGGQSSPTQTRPDCQPCAQNTYKATAGNQPCTPCPANTNTGTRLQSTVRDECRCNLGTARDADTGECLPCPTGTTCVSGGADVRVNPGFWRLDEAHQQQVYACPKESCLGGTNTTTCLPGYSGVLCAVCAQGYYETFNACSRCPDLAYSIVLLLLAALLLAAFVAYILLNKKPRATIGKFRILLAFLQVSSLSVDTYAAPWPQVFATFTTYLHFANLDFVQFSSLDCLGPQAFTYYTSATIVALVPLGLLAILGLVFLLVVFRKRHAWTALEIDDFRNSCLRAAIMIMIICFPAVSVKMTEYFKCRELRPGLAYMEADYRLRCDASSEEYANFLPFVLLMILIYPIMVPATVLWLLYRQRENLHEPTVLRRLGFLYQNVHERVYYWEVVELCRRIMVTALMVVVARGSVTQLIVGCLLGLFFLLVHVHVRPYRHRSDMILQTNSLLVIFLTLFIGLVLKAAPKELEDNSQTEPTFGWLLIGLHIALLSGFLVWMFGKRSVKLYQKREDIKGAITTAASALGPQHPHESESYLDKTTRDQGVRQGDAHSRAGGVEPALEYSQDKGRVLAMEQLGTEPALMRTNSESGDPEKQ